MKSVLALLAFGLAAVLALPANPERIIGGTPVTIDRYPFAVALLRGNGNIYSLSCGGMIITRNFVLSAAHCVSNDAPAIWRARIGSTFLNGNAGYIIQPTRFIVHYQYNNFNRDFDAVLIHLGFNLIFDNNVNTISLAGPNYFVGINTIVESVGWGSVSANGAPSEQLQHVQKWVIDSTTCANRYQALNSSYHQVTNNMVCAGSLNVSDRDFCAGDAGGALIQNGVAVGILSWSEGCSRAGLPGVSTKISSIASWIQINAQ